MTRAFAAAIYNLMKSSNGLHPSMATPVTGLPPPPPPPYCHSPFSSNMADIKFKSKLAEISVEKTHDSLLYSGPTHHFFHRRTSFVSYNKIKEETVQGASTTSKIVGVGIARLPIDHGLVIKAYHAPEFSLNIISVGLLQRLYEVLFFESIRAYPTCSVIHKSKNGTGSWDSEVLTGSLVSEYLLKSFTLTYEAKSKNL